MLRCEAGVDDSLGVVGVLDGALDVVGAATAGLKFLERLLVLRLESVVVEELCLLRLDFNKALEEHVNSHGDQLPRAALVDAAEDVKEAAVILP